MTTFNTASQEKEAKDRLARIDSTMRILDGCVVPRAEKLQDCLHATLVVLRELAAKESPVMPAQHTILIAATKYYVVHLEQRIHGFVANGDAGPVYQAAVKAAEALRKLLAVAESDGSSKEP